MPIIINGQTDDITIGGESVAIDSEVAAADALKEASMLAIKKYADVKGIQQ